MLIELHAENKITLPNEVVSKLGLSVGDRLRVDVKKGLIYLIPVGKDTENRANLQGEADEKPRDEALFNLSLGNFTDDFFEIMKHRHDNEFQAEREPFEN